LGTSIPARSPGSAARCAGNQGAGRSWRLWLRARALGLRVGHRTAGEARGELIGMPSFHSPTPEETARSSQELQIDNARVTRCPSTMRGASQPASGHWSPARGLPASKARDESREQCRRRPRWASDPIGQYAVHPQRANDRSCSQSRRRSGGTECAPVAEQTAPETARFDLQEADRPEVQGSRIARSR
jgi:hypothetical protein